MSSRLFAFILVFSSLQHLNLMDNPIYSHRRKLLLDDLCLRACPDVCHRYGINHSRLFRRLRPCCRITICHVKVYISLDAWNLSTARVLPSRYIKEQRMKQLPHRIRKRSWYLAPARSVLDRVLSLTSALYTVPGLLQKKDMKLSLSTTTQRQLVQTLILQINCISSLLHRKMLRIL